jgi:hypothetical protein
VISPYKNDNPLNGVTTFDLVLISKHILGTAPLNSPYKMIAADANKSNSITTFDIVELRKLILGIYLNLPNNTSWRFVDKAYVFPTLNNPFVPQFPENIAEPNLQMSALNEDFVALKVGDVNGTVVLNAQEISSDRETRETVWMDIQGASKAGYPEQIQAGETFTLSFKPSEVLAGYQFTLELIDLEVLDIQTSAGMGADHFGIFRDAVTGSFVSSDPAQTGAFSIRFRALAGGSIHEMLTISSRITTAEAYSAGGEMVQMDLKERFVGISSGHTAFKLYQNQPNPFSGSTKIPFDLPVADVVKLSIYDALGVLIYSRENSFEEGRNAFELDGSVLSGTGVLFYKVESSAGTEVKQMVRG